MSVADLAKGAAPVAVTIVSLCASGSEAAPPRWGFAGHEMATRAAVASLPSEMPAFFTDAADQLVYLSAEPDRWRQSSSVEMDRAWQYDHYIDFENVPEEALAAPDRFTYLLALAETDLTQPERDGGFLPFRIVELHQRLVSSWARWRAEADPDRKRWIEARIIDDAGVLSHYVTDGSQPHHTTIHFNGWARGTPNPSGYTTDREFHSRFERYFVEAHVDSAAMRERVPTRPAEIDGVRDAVVDYLRTTHTQVDRLYRLERDVGFEPGAPADPGAQQFAAERLAAGSAMLARLWWSAYVAGLR